jgi:hypothetical protein
VHRSVSCVCMVKAITDKLLRSNHSTTFPVISACYRCDLNFEVQRSAFREFGNVQKTSSES